MKKNETNQENDEQLKNTMETMKRKFRTIISEQLKYVENYVEKNEKMTKNEI